ncbi:complement factor H-related protein 1-like isoform X2 [Plectropomus leopardus]|uniref:complement factor H-related protein 1-like isoform X2 n=1 Tax=Plectropomus leopardus TaxID=160734 RepID=UPI001C4C26B0|nr:complement factor H-related protein 1-like isoform X2 [Plectropomus leopardus]
MCIRHLRIALLLTVFPGAPHAQSAAQSCHAPKLDGGFFSPKQETYSDGAKLTYACDEGLKPTVKGWWATSTCQNGKWSHKPQCIDQNDCFPPDLPNAKYKENPSGWYRNGHRIRITCDNGYEPKSRHVIATCIRGTWRSVPICEKHVDACGEPPKIPHAVIIQQEYQEVFAPDSEVQFECEGGYTVEETDTKNSIMCIFGNWTEGPTCISSSTSGSKERDSTTLITTVDNCGAYPVVSNGDVVEKDQNFLKYQCNAFYKLAGSDTVACYSDGSWSQLPICKEAFCVLDPAEHDEASFRLSGVEYLKDGEEKDIPCIQQDHSSRVQCTNGKLFYNKCAEKAGSAEVETAAGNATSTENGAQTEAVHVGDRLQLLPEWLSQWMKVAEQILGTEAPQSEKQAGDTLHQLAVGHNLQVEPTGSSNTSGSNESDSKPLITSETFCVIDPAQYRVHRVRLSGVEYIKEGENKHIRCIWHDYSSHVKCTNGILHYTQCCQRYDHLRGVCRYYTV